MIHRVWPAFCVVLCLTQCFVQAKSEFQQHVRPVLNKYCVACHSGDAPSGDVDFSIFNSLANVIRDFDKLEKAIGHLKAGTMPPADEDQPTAGERQAVYEWAQSFIADIDSRPAEFRPRRLSVVEYRNTLQSVFGFELRVAVIEAEQTLSERSLVVKLLPTDPPGESGFKNNTHRNPLSTVAWEQYSYLADAAIEQLFSPQKHDALVALAGDGGDDSAEVLTLSQAKKLLREFYRRTRRRDASADTLQNSMNAIQNKSGQSLLAAVKFEMKTLLMSPAFLYRGLLFSGTRGKRQNVDAYELAERLSYFLWADMPDQHLFALARSGELLQTETLNNEIDRMLAAPESRSLATVFATEWFTINEIEHVSNNPPVMLALKSQPIDFMHYLFTQNRPLLEMVDSETAFINPHTARMYGRDSRQMQRYVKQKGIEVEAVPNQKIQLQETTTRGGLLTMPGILAMNKGPIQRGTWILERIMGEELPDPPPDVGQVAPNRKNESLSFRQRFEQHRSKSTCAVCHDKIDPLGFVLQEYDRNGRIGQVNRNKKKKNGNQKQRQAETKNAKIDTSGKLPSGETFDDIQGLKKILTTTQRQTVIRNIVKRTLSYALCRKLMIYDRPVIESITIQMDETNGTWRDLFVAIANSVPFRETIVAPQKP